MTVLDTTTNNGFQYPSAGNDGTDFGAGLQDFANDVDAMWSSGTISARPSAGTLNRIYWATDTKLLYYDNGTSWGTVLVAGAWTPVPLNTGGGVAALSSSGYALATRQVGDQMFMRGGATSTINTSLVGTLATAFRPAQDVYFSCYVGGNPVGANILTNGTINTVVPFGTSTVAAFDSVSYSLA